MEESKSNQSTLKGKLEDTMKNWLANKTSDFFVIDWLPGALELYADAVAKEALQSLLLEAERACDEMKIKEKEHGEIVTAWEAGVNSGIGDCKQVLRNMRGV